MKARKLLVLVMALACIATISITATLAYFTDVSEAVKNTFTVGKVIIELDEAPVDEEGQTKEGDRIKANSYELIPGREYDKDPTVHVDSRSEQCYLFVIVENPLADIEKKDVDGQTATTILGQMNANGWYAVGGEDNGNVYYYGNADGTPIVVKPGEDKVIFEHFTIDAQTTNEQIEAHATATNEENAINITAYAIQSEGMDKSTALEIWNTYGGNIVNSTYTYQPATTTTPDPNAGA